MQRLRGLVQATKPEIDIHFNPRRTIYSTGDKIEGIAKITTPVKTQFDKIEIEFLGNTRTVVDSPTTTPALSGRTENFNGFLRIPMHPAQLSDHYPRDKVLYPGHTYEIPFSFTIPATMPDNACKGGVTHDVVRQAHLQLPPSFGDRDFANKDGLLDDMAPALASVRYGVFARILKMQQKKDEAGSLCVVTTKVRQVRVIPSTDEAPPLDVSGPRDSKSLYKRDYELRRERKVKKSVMGKVFGSLSIESEQPKELRMPSPDVPSTDRVTTMATVMLRYDPVKGSTAPLPKLEKLTAKLKVRTYYSTVARTDFPKPSSDTPGQHFRCQHSESLELSSRALKNVDWRREDAARPSQPVPLYVRRASASSEDSNPDPIDLATWVPEPSENYVAGEPFYIARLAVPIELPTNKFFVPTFHSCFLSRIYTIGLNLSFSPAGLHGSMDLRIPVQISASRSSALEPARRRSSAALASPTLAADFDADLAAAFEPFSRFVRPGADFRTGSPAWDMRRSLPSAEPVEDAPPGYDEHTLDRRFGERMAEDNVAMSTEPVC